ncbi:hypothetical protein HY030_02110 [Candidatus Gottesmanbacteria bacterium]|nr:hypothetical protein [Candidatus Gottesmanbacteria bacterium]
MIKSILKSSFSGLDKGYTLYVLLNTSFNLKGEPIVCSPEDAISTFLRSGIDILVMENLVVEKPLVISPKIG